MHSIGQITRCVIREELEDERSGFWQAIRIQMKTRIFLRMYNINTLLKNEMRMSAKESDDLWKIDETLVVPNLK